MRFKSSAQRRAFFYKLGNQSIHNSNYVMATTFDGRRPVKVYFPKKPNIMIKNKVENFLLNELDDHNALNKFRKSHGK